MDKAAGDLELLAVVETEHGGTEERDRMAAQIGGDVADTQAAFGIGIVGMNSGYAPGEIGEPRAPAAMRLEDFIGAGARQLVQFEQ